MTMGRKVRKRSVEYRAGEIGKVRLVKDFLPPPEKLVLRQDNVKVRSASAA